MAKVLVSYSRKNIEFAKRLTGELQKSDLDFCVDWEDIPVLATSLTRRIFWGLSFVSRWLFFAQSTRNR